MTFQRALTLDFFQVYFKSTFLDGPSPHTFRGKEFLQNMPSGI
jgi:hypothetical protein